jgi:hypothetical protein
MPGTFTWEPSLADARDHSVVDELPVLLCFSGGTECRGSVALETVTLQDPSVSAFVAERLLPIRVDAQRSRELVEQYAAAWTPLCVLLDANGRAHFRIEGFLPPDEFLAHVMLGTGRFELDHHLPQRALQTLTRMIREHPDSDAVAQALYWQAVARFRLTRDANRLRADWDELAAAHPDSAWAARTRIPVAAARAAG